MSSKKKHKDCTFIKCPFFHAQDPVKIFCEGIEQDSTIHIAFATGQAKKSFVRRNCSAEYQQCPIYKINDSKYDEMGNAK